MDQEFLARQHDKCCGDVRKAIMTVCLVANEPIWYLAINAVIGNVYWLARFWVYRKR